MPTPPIRLGVVSFVNALPLIDGLEPLEDVDVRTSVPSVLIDLLMDDEVECAMCSSIDLARATEPVVVLPSGLLGCDGPTLTVRLFSNQPIQTLERVYCDTDSHTSVVLLRILLRDVYDIDPEIVPYDAREHVAENGVVTWPDAMLLIGDKVVTNATPAVRYPHQLDLGATWREQTGLPFVFATWLAKASMAPDRLEAACAILDRQRRMNAMRLDAIVGTYAEPRGWPADLAREYLTERIAYEVTPARQQGLATFLERAHAHGLIEQPAVPAWCERMAVAT